MKSPRLVITFLLLSPVAHAAVISWSGAAYVNTGSAKNTMGIDQFDQNGTLVLAVNFGSAGAQTLVQSVDPNIAFAASNPSLTVSNMGGSAPAGTFHANLGSNNNLSGTGIFTPGTQDQSSPGTITIANLVDGQAYRIEALLMDGRGSFSGRTVSFDGTSLGTYANGVGGVTWGDGLLATGVFTASGTSQSFDVQVFSGTTSLGGQVNALTLHAVPEPASSLLVLGTLVMGCRRRPGSCTGKA